MFKTNKKLYSFILFAFLISCWSSTAQTLIYHENFETTPISLNSTSTGTGTWALNTRLHAEGSHCDSVTVNTGDTTYLSSNSFSTVGKNTIYLDFKHIAKVEYFDACEIEVSNNGGTSWTKLTTTEYKGNGLFLNNKFTAAAYSLWVVATNAAVPQNSWWKHEHFDISTLVANAANVKIRFVITDKNNNGSQMNAGWFIDDVKVLENSCKTPANQSTSDITGNSVVVAWTEKGTATQWDIEYGPSGFNLGTGTRITATSNPDTLTGLTALTNYDWYVRARCSANNSSYWSGLNSFITGCARIASFPWNEGFENLTSTGNGIIPTCMEKSGNWVSQSGSSTSNNFPHSGSKFISISMTYNDWLISPEFYLVAGTHYDFSFWYVTNGASVTIETKVGNYQIKDSLKTIIGTPISSVNDTIYQKYEVAFIPSTSGSYYFGVHATIPNICWSSVSFDDFKLDAPSCPHPSNQALLSLTSNSAIVDWTENGSASQWDIEYDTAGYTFGTGNRLNAISKPDTLGPLVSGKNYDWYVRAKCGSNDSSTWYGPHNFSFVGTHTLPIYDDFENGYSYFNNKASNNIDFIDATNLFHSGSHCIRNNYGDNNSNVFEETGIIDLSSTPNAILDFWHIAKTEENTDKCYVEISTDAGNSYTPLPSSTYLGTSTNYSSKGYFHEKSYSAWGIGYQTPTNTWWKHEYFNLSGYCVSNVRIRFRITSDGSGHKAGWYLDDIKISVPTCPKPTNLNFVVLNPTTAILRWTENGSATQWQIEYDTANFVKGTGTIVTANTNPDTITGLSPNTAYDWYVRASCSANDTSDWSTFTSTFNTSCPVITSLPWTEGFENMTTTGYGIIPQCAKGDGDWETKSTPASYNRSAHLGSNYLYTNYDADDWYISPTFHLIAGTSYDYSFFYVTDGKTGWKIEAKIGSMQIKDSMLTAIGTPIIGPTNTTYQQYRTTFTVSTTGYYNVGLHVEGHVVPWIITFDDFKLEKSPTCPQPTNLSLINISTDSAIINWTEMGSATHWDIEYGHGGFTQGSGTVIHTANKPDTISSLLPGTNYDCYVRARCSSTDSSYWTIPINFTTECSAITTLPWLENFENMTTNGYGIIPNCTKEYGDWGTYFMNGSTILYTSDDADDWYLGPKFFLTAGTSYDYSFYYYTDGNNGWTKIETKIGNKQYKDSMRTAIGTPVLGPTNTIKKQYIATFTVNTSGYYYIGLHIVANSTPVTIYFDDFMLQETPTCSQPTNLSLISTSADTAIISWTETGSATQWEIEYGFEGFSLGSGTVIHSTHKPDTITSLLSGKRYDFYVRARCSTTDSSHWSGPLNFTTNCFAITSLPWTEGFEHMKNFGTIVPKCMLKDGDWNVLHSLYTTHNRKPKTGNNYLCTKSKANDWFISPEFHLTAGTSYDFSFQYITDGANGWDTVETKIGRYQHKDSMLISIGNVVSGPINTIYKEYKATFIPTVTGSYYFGVHVIANSTPDYITFDDFMLEETPTCPRPTQPISTILPNKVILNWTEEGSATQWDYEYGTTGFSLGTGTRISTNSKPDTISGLAIGTYDWYVRARCSATDSSTWISAPLSSFLFSTLEAISFADSFDVSNTFIAANNSCWQKGDPEGTHIDTAHSSPNAWMTNLNNGYPNNTESYLYTPFFDFSNVLPTDSSVLSFYHWIDVHNYDGGYIQYTSDYGSTWLTLGYKGISVNKATNWYNKTKSGKHFWNALNTGWQKSDIKLPFHGATPIQFRFVFFSNYMLNAKDGWAIDDFKITLPLKSKDVGITAITAPSGSVQLGANVNVTATIKNHGTASQTSFPVKYTINGSNPVTQTFTATGTGLAPNTTQPFTFNTAFSAPAQNFKLCVYTDLSNDAYTYNDTICTMISTTPAALDAGVISIVANPHWNDTTKSSFDNSVSIQIVNFGINTLTSIPLEYKVGTTVKANETWTGTLASTDTVSYTFTTTYKSNIGHYNLCASSKLQNDVNASNNSKCHNYLGIIDANIDYADGYKFLVNQNEPNPATDKARIDLIIPENGKLIFALRNNLGQLITEKIYNFSMGNNSIIFDVHNLPSGVYYYSVTFRNNKITKQMIVK